jgi:hypothetical protein
MNYNQLLENILAGKANVEYQGHTFSKNHLWLQVEESLRSQFIYGRAITREPKGEGFDICKYIDEQKQTEISGDILVQGLRCNNCSERFQLNYDHMTNIFSPIKVSWDSEHNRVDEPLSCLTPKSIMKTKKVDVYFPTGEIVFTDRFENKVGDFDEYELKKQTGISYDLDTHIGRYNRMQYMSKELGVAFGQLTNTCYNIYTVGTYKILITEAYIEVDIPTDWVFRGAITCDTWRYEAMDLSLLNKANTPEKLELPDAIAIASKYTTKHAIVDNMSKGEWVLSHYFESTGKDFGDFKGIKRKGIEIFAEFDYSRKQKIDNILN